jgi:phage protein D
VTSPPPPDLKVIVNRVPLPEAALEDLRAVTVQEDLRDLSMFALELNNWDDERLRVSWSDSDLFAIGAEVEIWLGYAGDLHQVMLAEITSLEPAFLAGQEPLLTVRGYDHRHRLARGRHSRTFVHMTDSEIVRRLAREAGLRPEISETYVMHEYVIQPNQSDWEFLRRRASLIGYEVYVRDKALCFRLPPGLTGQTAATLSLGSDITEFSPRLSAFAQAGQVIVRGWDIRGKKVVTATAGSAPSEIPGSMPDATIGDRAFGLATVPWFDDPVREQPEAEELARARYHADCMTFVEGEATAFGRPLLRAGTVVDIKEAGETFSGPYYVTSVAHSVTPEHGYQTSFTVQRNSP